MRTPPTVPAHGLKYGALSSNKPEVTVYKLSNRPPFDRLRTSLGSVSAIVDGSGNLLSEQRYLPFGEVHAEVGTISQTDFSFTGQRSISMLSIMDYIARMYDPAIGRFVQPDTIIPNPANPQSWNRYSYGYNNPSRFTDPSGHVACQSENWDDGPQCKLSNPDAYDRKKIFIPIWRRSY